MRNIYTTLFLLVTINFATAQNWEWLRTSGGSNDGWELASTIDGNDNIIYGGAFTSANMIIGSDTLVNNWAPNPVGFLIKVNSSGGLVWSKVLSHSSMSLNFAEVEGVDTDGFGNIYVTGSFGGGEAILEFGNGVEVATLDNSAFFVAKFNPAGSALWAKTGELSDWFSGQGIEGKAIVVDDVGNAYVSCDFSGDTVTIDQMVIPNLNYGAGGDDLFIVKFAPNGNTVSYFSTELDTRDGSSLTITPLGNIILATQFINSIINYGGGNFLVNPTPGTKEGALIKFNSSLGVIWAKDFGSDMDDEFTDVDVDNLGNIYVTGGFQGPGTQFTFAGTTILNATFFQGLILKFNSQGTEIGPVSTTSPSGNELSYFTDIDIVNHNEMYVTCLYSDDGVELGSSSLPNPGYFNSFVARVDSTGDAQWMYTSIGSDSTIFKTLQHDQDGNLYVGGWYKGSSISFDANFAINTMSGPYDSFLAKLANSCDLNLSFTIADATCGQNTGAALATVAGGSGSGFYNYQWTSGDSTQVADSLTSGIYQVVVTDSITGCEVSGVAMVSDIGGASINVVGAGTNNVTCSGGNDGAILINLVGGQSPLSVSWSNGETTQSLNNLTAGPYDVTVEDDLGCITTESIIISEPDAFNLTYTSTDAGCGTTDGSANVHVEGSTAPYTYQWSSGGTDTTEINLGVGDYIFTVTDVNGCSDTILAMINEANGPIITIDSVLTASCANGNGGSVYISVSGEVGPYTYQWSNGGGTNEDLIGVAPGLYAVMVTAGNGCSSMTSGPVSVEFPETQELCLVTVDTTTGYNLVTWEKPVVGHISHYNIYQEQTQAGVYNFVGSVPYVDLSQFVDSLADPIVRSFRYKIGAVDTCGIESELSWEHKTIHMVKSSFGGNNYLSWDNYEGFTYPSFNIWKYTDQTGWVNIYTLPSSLNSYTDQSPVGTNIDYFVEAVPNNPCSSTKAQDHNSTRSNRTSSIVGSGVGIFEYNNIFVNLFPNPTKNRFQIRLSNGSVKKWSVEVYDISGKSISHTNGLSENNYQIDLTSFESGIYLVRVQMGNKMVFRKVVKQ